MLRRTAPAVAAGAAGVAVAAVALWPGTARADSAPAPHDVVWLTSTAAGDLFEIEGAQTAETHAHSTAVKALGARLAADHIKSASDLLRFAALMDVHLPTEPDPKDSAELSRLALLHGTAFDKEYLKTEISHHKKAISAARKEIAAHGNTEIVEEARRDLPVLRAHLRLAEQTQSRIGR
ncbi:DUF4142 domain-containing protein [Streptomyces sediminimaris]|uniref:DUF4142 domain-containing protein n=1 Tax=Streptomyces sediminimaris TaxID=3383721 RepID=UPI0039995550